MTARRTKGPLERATFNMFKAAPWLATAEYLGPKEALLALARKIDKWDAVVLAAEEWAAEKSGRRPNVPLHDGNSLGSYFRACAELGLTPTSRAKLERIGENLNRGGDPKPGGADDHSSAAGNKATGKLATVTSLRTGVSPS